jgi:hypothetical protein
MQHFNILRAGYSTHKRFVLGAEECASPCRDCGYQINADLNGAKSIAMRHDLTAMGRYFCEYPWKEVNRPGAVRSSEKKRQVRYLKPQAPSTARPRA